MSRQPEETREIELLSPQQQKDLSDTAKQAEYREAYVEQLKMRNCSECGDGPAMDTVMSRRQNESV